MQLSTNRVNFTNASVAQFNYVKFLSQFRSRKNGVQDIGNILRLHNNGFALKGGFTTKVKFRRAVSKCLHKNRALVLYVAQKKLIMKIPKCLQWYRFVILVLIGENHKILIEFDIKMSMITINFYISEIAALWTINTVKSGIITKSNVHTSKCNVLYLYRLIYLTFQNYT